MTITSNAMRRFSTGAKEGAQYQIDTAHKIAQIATDKGASAETTIAIVRRNVQNQARTLGRRLDGASKPLIALRSSGKRTGKAYNRAKIAQQAATSQADTLKRYYRMVEVVNREAQCKDRTRRKHAKSILRLARKISSTGEIAAALEILNRV